MKGFQIFKYSLISLVRVVPLWLFFAVICSATAHSMAFFHRQRSSPSQVAQALVLRLEKLQALTMLHLEKRQDFPSLLIGQQLLLVGTKLLMLNSIRSPVLIMEPGKWYHG